jgi:hypothetical protein
MPMARGEDHMSRRRFAGRARARGRPIATLLAAALVLVVLVPPASATTAPLHLTVRDLTFTSFACRADNPMVCDATATGVVNSNLATTTGTVDYTLVIDFSPGSDCNIVDETALFTFDTGTLTIQSHHLDCPATVRPGPRIDAHFTITNGSRAFAGATGSGTERSAHADEAPVLYNGTIAY